MFSSVVLPDPFGPTSATTLPDGTSTCNRGVPTRHRGTGGQADRCASLRARDAAVVRQVLHGRHLVIEHDRHECPDLVVLQPRRPGAVHPAQQRAEQSGWRNQGRAGGVAVTNVPMPCRRTTSPSCSSSPYALTTVLGLIASAFTTSFAAMAADLRSPPSEHHLAAHLLDQLPIDRHLPDSASMRNTRPPLSALPSLLLQ